MALDEVEAKRYLEWKANSAFRKVNDASSVNYLFWLGLGMAEVSKLQDPKFTRRMRALKGSGA